MINKFKLKFGRPQRGYRFKPGECVVNHNWAEKFRQGKSSQKQFDEMKMVIMEAGIGKETGAESYRLLYDFPSAAGSSLRGQTMINGSQKYSLSRISKLAITLQFRFHRLQL